MKTAEQIMDATYPEDIFGRDATKVRKVYRALAQQVHPDHAGGSEAAFAKLNELHEVALAVIAAGRYGARSQAATKNVVIQTRRHGYRVTGLAHKGSLASIYNATYDDGERALLKIVRDPRESPRLVAEGKALKQLLAKGSFDLISPYLPAYIEAFGYRAGGKTRQALAFKETPGAIPIDRVVQVYPRGVHAKDSAWMFRRLLYALGLAHGQGLAHTRLMSAMHILIIPEQHGVVLLDWAGAQRATPETAGGDLASAAKIILHLTDPGTMPRRLANFYSAVSTSPGRRLPDGLALLDEYDELIGQEWGKRRFRPFSMVG